MSPNQNVGREKPMYEKIVRAESKNPYRLTAAMIPLMTASTTQMKYAVPARMSVGHTRSPIEAVTGRPSRTEKPRSP